MNSTWILTFNRPVALTRLIKNLSGQGIVSNVFSNHPMVSYDEEFEPVYGIDTWREVINTLNSSESNSWCARSWNTIFMKAFNRDKVDPEDGVICLQDDTNVSPDFAEWMREQTQKYDFIWGPGGDQFFYIKYKVLRAVGWWDERYIGCYCADADFMKRVFFCWNPEKLSIEESHNWGFYLNRSGVREHIDTEMHTKTIDPNYENQHWELEKLSKVNRTLLASQRHYELKWGKPLDNGRPSVEASTRNFGEIDWYPWFSTKHKFQIYSEEKND